MTETTRNVLRSIAASILAIAAAYGILLLGAYVFGTYGWTVFFILPIFLGATSTLIYDPKGDRPFWQCLLVGHLSIAVMAFLIMITAIEGLLCLAMALPIAIPGIALGVAIGWSITRSIKDSRAGAGFSVLLFLLMPLLMGFETSERSTPTVHEVVSTVVVDAPIEKVWKNVIEFPRIDHAPDGVLALGFAYPIDARIDGNGVGATRYCNFNTGSFVEPITVWEAPHVLAFDVRQQPAPMTELSPYSELKTPHLLYIKSQKGQFRLYEKDGMTVIEGTTFYTHDIAPDAYWKLFSDAIIHRIHLRVLQHIKTVSESQAAAPVI